MRHPTAIDGDTLIKELLDPRQDRAGILVRIGPACFICGKLAWWTAAKLGQSHRGCQW
jgi:hypothetical protein